jgi:hypothetical protein
MVGRHDDRLTRGGKKFNYCTFVVTQFIRKKFQWKMAPKIVRHKMSSQKRGSASSENTFCWTANPRRILNTKSERL